MDKVIVISGATAVGKTDISIKLAKMFNGEIINADASQFHKELNIGTAKTTLQEMDGVKHYLIDFIEPNVDYSAYDYQKDARKIVNNIIKESKLPFIVGGSGLYINTLIYDYKMDAKKSIHDDHEYDDLNNEELYALLDKLDHNLALHTHPNNRNRVLRYIERAKDGNTFDSLLPDKVYDYLFIHLVRSRESLYERINKRTLLMLENGWIDEVKGLIEKGIDISKIKEIGYKEIYSYLNGEITYDELVDLIQKETRHYAKRQVTWFKHKADTIEVDLDKDSIEDISKLIKDFLDK